LIQQVFNQRDASEIIKIPLNLLQNDDVPIWRFSRNGTYSVRSAYYQLMEVIIDNSHLKVEGNWKKLWQLHVPNKVKLFLWRALRGCLPVRGQLVQKGVRCNNKCPHCDNYEENEWHCFFGCNTVNDLWMETEEWQHVSHYMNNAAGFVSMIFQMIEEIEHADMAKITMLLWSIWWRRNQRCWQNKVPSALDVIRRARDSLNDWVNVQQQNTSTSRDGTTLASHTWTKPARGTLKCNIDAACYNEQNVYCIGACLRDEQGRFVQAFTTRLHGSPDIAEAEATGLLEALRWMQQPQLTNVNIAIEMDCLQVVKAMHARPMNMTEFGSIINLCHSLLVENDDWKINYVRRQANRVAHALAQATRFTASPKVYNYCPPCIEPIIINEMN
jgi:ribonuclease HI